MSKKQNVLPTTPSELLKVALDDIEKVQKLKSRIVDLDVWHEPLKFKGKTVCAVCFAGAVMDRTFKIPARTDLSPGGMPDITEDDRQALRALDAFRLGDVRHGLQIMSVNFYGNLDRDMPGFYGKGTKFKKAIRQLIKDLEAVEL